VLRIFWICEQFCKQSMQVLNHWGTIEECVCARASQYEQMPWSVAREKTKCKRTGRGTQLGRACMTTDSQLTPTKLHSKTSKMWHVAPRSAELTGLTTWETLQRKGWVIQPEPRK